MKFRRGLLQSLYVITFVDDGLRRNDKGAGSTAMMLFEKLTLSLNRTGAPVFQVRVSGSLTGQTEPVLPELRSGGSECRVSAFANRAAGVQYEPSSRSHEKSLPGLPEPHWVRPG